MLHQKEQQWEVVYKWNESWVTHESNTYDYRKKLRLLIVDNREIDTGEVESEVRNTDPKSDLYMTSGSWIYDTKK